MRAWWFVVAMVVMTGRTSYAWVPGNDPPIVMAGPGAPRTIDGLDSVRGLDGSWQGLVDRDTGVLVELWGPGLPAPGATSDPALAEQAAWQFLASHLDRLAPGSALSDFRIIANRLDGKLRTVAFGQMWRGIPVLGGQLHVVFGGDRLIAAGGTALPHVLVPLPRTNRAADAIRARTWLAGSIQRSVVVRRGSARMIVPIRRGGSLQYELADRLELDAVGAPGRWDVYVRPDGTPIMRVNRLLFAASTLGLDVGVRYPAVRQVVPADHADLTVDAVATTTASDGAFSWAGTNPAQVATSVSGSYVNVINATGSAATAQLTAQPDASLTWSMATSVVDDAQLAAFVYGSLAKARARIMAPGLASWLDQPLAIYVNEAGSCNAFANATDLHFFQQSSGCENTARLADVVLHEFGHALHAQAVIPGEGATNAALSEGLADYFAATIVDDSQIGRGFDFTDQPVRDLDPVNSERVWPVDRSIDPHETGLIIAGALWDLRKALIAASDATQGAAFSDAILIGVMQRSPDIPSSYMAALLADDDDADLGNGTPHRCAIATAFGKHGITAPDYAPTTIATPAIDKLSVTVAVNAPTDTACPPAQVTSMKLRWQLANGVMSTIDLVQHGGTWVGSLPAFPKGSVIRYAITAALDDSSALVLPDNPADPMYQDYIGAAEPIWCERLDADPMWTQSGDTAWEWAEPSPSPSAWDPADTHTGTHVLGTDLTEDGAYRSNEVTRIETPAIDVSKFHAVRLQYWRHLAVEDASRDTASIEVNGTPVWTNASGNGTLDHIDKEWRFHDVDLAAFDASPIQLAWQIASDSDGQLGGWSLDDICLVGTKNPVCGDGELDPGEACDDGNTDRYDGCSDTCGFETLDTGCCSTTSHPAAPAALAVIVVGALRRRRTPSR